jgi:hypothetical protein
MNNDGSTATISTISLSIQHQQQRSIITVKCNRISLEIIPPSIVTSFIHLFIQFSLFLCFHSRCWLLTRFASPNFITATSSAFFVKLCCFSLLINDDEHLNEYLGEKTCWEGKMLHRLEKDNERERRKSGEKKKKLFDFNF